MKLKKLFGLIVTVIILLAFLGSCESELPEACPDAKFMVNADDDSTEYTLTADFDGMENLSYSWYVNGVLVETEDSASTRNDIFDFKFAQGTYNVCLKASSAECGGEISFCKEIIVKRSRKGCPELKFAAEQVSDHKYMFTADFDSRDTLRYTWYVNGDSVESESMDGERHHKFDYAFRPGTHRVCIKANTDRCGKLVYCKEITVDEPKCPELEFEAVLEGSFGYTFTSIFEGKGEVQYKWQINGAFVDKENFEGHDTDHTLYWQFEPGTYSVCIQTLATDNCEAREYCKEIVVEGDKNACPDVHFGYEHLGGNEYKFQADFEGKYDLKWYGWYINGELVENEGTEHDGDHYLKKHLEPGTYEVCLKTETPDCPEGISYCKELIVESRECIDVAYTYAKAEGGYKFTADFEMRENVTYLWKVYVAGDLLHYETRYAGSEDDHEFFLETEAGVTYEVCLKQDDCPDSAYCKEITQD